jgi:hypothetical protein
MFEPTASAQELIAVIISTVALVTSAYTLHCVRMLDTVRQETTEEQKKERQRDPTLKVSCLFQLQRVLWWPGHVSSFSYNDSYPSVSFPPPLTFYYIRHKESICAVQC